MTLWTVAPQASLSMEFSRQEYCSELTFPSLGDLPNSGIKPGSPALEADLSHQGSPLNKSWVCNLKHLFGFPGSSAGKESACNIGDLGSIPGSGRFPAEGMAIHCSILAWRIPWTEEPGRLQFILLQRVRHDKENFTLYVTSCFSLAAFKILYLWI